MGLDVCPGVCLSLSVCFVRLRVFHVRAVARACLCVCVCACVSVLISMFVLISMCACAGADQGGSQRGCCRDDG